MPGLINTPAAAYGPETVRRRYIATLFTQSMQLLAAILSAGIVPRVLGPAVYGNYNFLLNTAASLRSFLDPSAQHTFFTFSSQDQRSGPLTKLYGLALLTQMGIIFAAIGLSALAGITNWLWPGQMLDQIFGVTLLDWILFCVLSLRQLGDSKGLTVTAQAISAITSLITIVSLFALIAVGWLDFYTFVGINMISALVAGAVLVYYLLYVNYDLCFAGSLRGKINEYLYRWWRYAAPLILVEYYTPLIAYLSQYMIQLWYGSAEQGYFALALRWSALVLVFTSSALMIVWREIAHFIARGERERAGQVYLRFNYLLFFLAIVLCFWLSIISPALVPLLAGEQYQKSVPILMMMAFYPVQQTYGQLNTAALKAADLTKQVRNLGFLISIPDLLLTYFLLAPSTGLVPGLGLGSFGVAFRMVCYGLVSVQLYEWSSFRFFGLNYSKSLLDKFVVTLMVGICASVILGGLQTWLEMQWRLGSILSIVLSTGLYFFIIGLMVISSPGLAGLDRAQVLRFYQLIKRF